MIHARIDTVEHRKIVGFETGTRAQFDKRHGGDPLWVFLDLPKVKYRVSFAKFSLNPWNYKLDANDNPLLTDEPPIVIVEENPDIPFGYLVLTGRDGRVLRGEDQLYLLGQDPEYVPAPDGMVYLKDPDDRLLKDPDNRPLIEPE